MFGHLVTASCYTTLAFSLLLQPILSHFSSLVLQGGTNILLGMRFPEMHILTSRSANRGSNSSLIIQDSSSFFFVLSSSSSIVFCFAPVSTLAIFIQASLLFFGDGGAERLRWR